MNDRHPSGNYPADASHDFSYPAHGGGQYEQSAHDIYAQQGQSHLAAYDGYSTGTFDNPGFSYDGSYGDGDPLFGSMPGANTGTDNGTYATGTYDAYSGQSAYGTGAYDTSGMWTNGEYAQTAHIPAQPGPDQDGFSWSTGTGQWETGNWDSGQWGNAQDGTGQWDADQWDSPAGNGSWDAYGDGGASQAQVQPGAQPQGYDSPESYGSYDGFDPGTAAGYGAHEQQQPSYDEAFTHDSAPDATTALPGFESYHGYSGHDGHDDVDDLDVLENHDFAPDAGNGPDDLVDDAPHDAPDDAVVHLRGRRRSPRPRRSALLSVAVPSVAVMGVAGAAAASVVGNAPQDATTTQASADVAVKPANKKLDTQLAGLSADADDFADRASRTQERLDLKQRQELERQRKAKEAARKEAMRPKFALPVKEHGLSATFGQAGTNWMSVHTGIDFPVSEGTTVMAATDGTVTTKYDISFGNMAVVTASDGTETWYCHLSSTKVRSGSVKAGDTIAYSGTSGNSTGPHLHFEVHPGGGDAVDPQPWLRSKGIDPN